MSRKISVIHPSRGRAERAFKSYETLRKNAVTDFEYILSIDDNEPEIGNYLKWAGVNDSHFCIKPNRSVTDAALVGCNEATGDILMIFSDDFEEMPRGWDQMILQATEGREMWALNVDDTIHGHKWIHTIPIVDRKLYEFLGHIYNPIYRHMFSDTELAAIGDLMQVTINAPHIKFPHHHYLKFPKTKDKINDRNNSFWNADQETYLMRFKDNFGLRGDQTKGKITDKSHLDWCLKMTK